ncbi:MAG: ABC transporter substrate-binding protein [Oscillospiraceae bacterium]|jgi:arabinosaccharide transport system substrate-binding protein|nr:ABC transporter substrate-binding protein [Oscillospiraceae bacterium]
MKKLLAMLMALSMLLGIVGVASAEAAPTKLTLWTFIDQHAQFYNKMAEEWNKVNPDKQIALEATVLGYDDMHNKLKIALQSGVGAPDLCDVELGQFPNVLLGQPQLVVLNDALAPYIDTVVPSRLSIYSKGDNHYGVPTHVGASVAFYNVELLEAAGIDYKTIITWDDWSEAGKKLKEATPGVYMGNVETTTQWQTSLMLTEQGADFQDNSNPDDPKPTINTPELLKAVQTQQQWLKDGIAYICPGGQVDTEEGKAWLNTNVCATVIMPEWYMSRFVDEIPDLAGKYAIAPAPVFEVGQPRSIGLGGTGTVVTLTCPDIPLAGDFITWAKLSETGESMIWDVMGFDPVNTAVWDDEALTHNPENKFNKYFLTNVFDTLNEIKGEIKFVASTSISPTMNSYFSSTLWNNLYIDLLDAESELETAQEAIEADIF